MVTPVSLMVALCLSLLISFSMIPCASGQTQDSELIQYYEKMKSRLEETVKNGSLPKLSKKLLEESFELIEEPKTVKGLLVGNYDNYWQKRVLLAQLRLFERSLDEESGKTVVVADDAFSDKERNHYKAISGYQKQKRIGTIDNQVFPIRDRIDNGIADGSLTEAEASYLNNEFYRIREMSDRWASDTGRLSDWERNALRLLTKEYSLIVDSKLINDRHAPGVIPQISKYKFSRENHDVPMTGHYIWHASKHGGFYDATGRINGNIPENQLYLYGGSRADGLAIHSPDPNKKQTQHLTEAKSSDRDEHHKKLD